MKYSQVENDPNIQIINNAYTKSINQINLKL